MKWHRLWARLRETLLIGWVDCLSDGFAVLQPSFLDSLAFDPFSPVDDGLGSSEVDVGWRDVVEALVISFMIIVIDEAPDLLFQISR